LFNKDSHGIDGALEHRLDGRRNKVARAGSLGVMYGSPGTLRAKGGKGGKIIPFMLYIFPHPLFVHIFWKAS
jgi:hypothetical protein